MEKNIFFVVLQKAVLKDTLILYKILIKFDDFFDEMMSGIVLVSQAQLVSIMLLLLLYVLCIILI